MNKKTSIFLAILIAFSLVLTACGSGFAAEPDKVTVQFSWFPTVEFAGFYVADQLGYYAEENLEVNLVAGGPDIDPVSEVAAGNAQFGLAAGDSILRAKANGQDMMAVGAIFRQSPMVVMALADSGIQRPQDLEGKTIGVISPTLDTTWDIQFIAMLHTLGIDENTMTFVPNELYGVGDLTSGKMDASSGMFSTNEPIQAELDGYKVNLIYYSDYGVEFYNNLIFAASSLVAEDADLVQRFMRATLKGYQHAIESPQDAVDHTIKYASDLDPSFELATMQLQIPLIDTGNAPIGFMDDAVWQNTQSILIEQGYLDTPVDLNTVYTNKFVEGSH
ncbi:MAG: ABC transporter substrate-binding protein [Chloroflexota bacterium]